MTKLPIILDNAVDLELQNRIEDVMFDCLWKYANDNSYADNKEYRKFVNPFEYNIAPAFISNLQSTHNQHIYNKVISPLEKSCKQINFNLKKVRRCYAAIHAVVQNNSKQDNVHVNDNNPHLVLLYYVNSSDGDTILYDKTLEDIPNPHPYIQESYNLNITHRITPKRGRILFFDGRFYHSSSTPSKSMRCIVTLDLFGEFEDGSYKFPAPKENLINTKFRYQ